MAKRFTDTEIWDKEWFMKLSPKLKCLVKMVRDKCDLSGVWSPNFTIASLYIGEKVTEQELLSIDGGRQFKKSGEKIICLGFVDFQYGNLSEKSPVHRKILNLLEGHQIPYIYPINRVKEEEKDNRTEFEKCMAVYFNWHKEKYLVPPKIDDLQGKSLKSIITYLHTIETVKEGRVSSHATLKFIFDNWNKLDDFAQKRIKLNEINSDISKIIAQIKVNKNGNKLNNYSPGELADAIIEEARKRTQ